MRNKLNIIISNLLLISITGVLLMYSYYWLINSINEQEIQLSEVRWGLKNELASINNLPIKSPELITPTLIADNDKKFGTNLYSEIASHAATVSVKPESLIQKLEEKKLLTEKQLNNTKEIGFWDYLPPWPTLIFGALGVFLTRFIINFSDFISSWIAGSVSKK